MGLGSVLEASYHFYYSPRGRVSSYFGFTSTFWADLRELFKGLFGAVLWLFGAVYGLFKGLFGASFKVCLRGCLGLFMACLRGCLGPVLRFI